MTEENAPERLSPGLRAGIGTGAGFGLVALTNALYIAALLPRPALGLRIRLQHYLFDATETLGLGFLAALVVFAGVTLMEQNGRSPRMRRVCRIVGFVVYAVLAGAITHRLLGYELHRICLARFGGRFHDPLFVVGSVGMGISIPGALAVGWALADRKRLRIVLLLLGFGVMVTNLLVLRDDYAGLHGALAWFSATIVAMPLAGLLEGIVVKRPQRTRKAVLLVLGAMGVFGLSVSPSSTVRAEIFRAPAPIAAWALATFSWQMPGDARGGLSHEAAESPYFQARDALPPIAPTTPKRLDGLAPLVVLITIDATRADAVDSSDNESIFPTLTGMKRRGAYFAHATSAGSQTAVALSSLFSGRYFSQLEWSEYGNGPLRFSYPALDTTPRFPELLQKRGITTVSYCSIAFLAGEFGVLRGFAEETIAVRGREHAPAAQIIDPLLQRLERVRDEPIFLYAHLTEPHAPYDRAGTEGTNIQQYLREIAIADEYIGKVLDVLQKRFARRAYLFVSSDHGEAFGEHGTTKHTKTLYDELLRVPLLVMGPGIAIRRIDQHVTVMDLGPTILDLFGVDTPASFMGQSLVPLLKGRDVLLDRPILAEGRLRRALYWGDLKVIEDPRRKVVEAYDIQHDPRELRNRFDTDPTHVAPALAALRHFFDVHRVRKPGYETPYKP